MAEPRGSSSAILGHYALYLPTWISLHIFGDGFQRDSGGWAAWLSLRSCPRRLLVCSVPFCGNLSSLSLPRVARKGKFLDGLECPTLTNQDSCVLVSRVKGALALPIHDLVYQDGQQEGILEFLEEGRGWEPRMPGSHV